MNIEQTDNFIASLGLESYRVGGSVRDELIGREPKDADYMIRGISLLDLYGELISALRGSAKITDLTLRDGQHVGYRVGRPFDIEIALPRREQSTGPGHGDFKIIVDPSISLEEDAQRRDFTFNALYAPVGKLHALDGLKAAGGLGDPVVFDPTGRGLHDLQRRIINVTHADSFRDDPLRILRALRFVARSYDLGPETLALMTADAEAITGLTANGHMSGTVFQEMSNILMGTEARTALRVARDTGVLGSLFPELEPMLGFDQSSKYHDLTTDEHTFAALDIAVVSEATLRVRWALLFHDSGKPATAWTDDKGYKHFYARADRSEDFIDPYNGQLQIDHEEQSEWLWRQAAERMGIDKTTREEVATLIAHHMVPFKSKGVAVRTRRMRVQLGPGLLYDLLMHRVCDLMGKDGSANVKHVEQIRDMVRYLNKAREDKIPYNLKQLQVNGRDVMAALEPGAGSKMIGFILDAVLDEVVVRADELALTREWQLKAVERIARTM